MNEKISSGLFSRKAFLTVYLLGLSVPFLFYIMETAGSSYSDIFRDNFRMLLLCVTSTAAMGVCATAPSLPKKLAPASWLVIAAFLWIMGRFLIDRDLLFYFDAGDLWRRGYAAWFLFYPLCGMLNKSEIKKAVIFLAAVWSGAYALLSCLGIYAAATKTVFYTIDDYSRIGIIHFYQTHRLWLMKYATVTAENLLMGCALAVTAVLMSDRKWVKIVFSAAFAVMYIALGLTDGRTGMIALGAFLGTAAFVYVIGRFPGSRKKGVLLGLAAAILTLVLSYSVESRMQTMFTYTTAREIHYNEVFHRPYPTRDEEPEEAAEDRKTAAATPEDTAPAFHPVSVVAPTLLASGDAAVSTAAPAADAGSAQMAHREIESTLTGRTKVWKSALEALIQNDDNILIMGKTPYLFRDVLERHGYPKDMSHSHNIYLQIVLEWGLPGLVIMVAFLIQFCMAAFRLMFSFDLPFWERFISGPAIALLVAELADCFTMLYSSCVALFVLFLFFGLTIGLDRKHRGIA